MAKLKFISALGYRWSTAAYDFLIEATMPEPKIKLSMIDSAYLTEGATVLDIGCGTATLTTMSKEHRPAINIIGIDIDKSILNKATEKVNRKNCEIKLVNYDGERLPFEDNSFDRIISCLVFHHLITPAKMIQNLIWATGYNVVALLLAAGVFYKMGILISPALGAVLMIASTVVVAINTSLLKIK